MLLDKVNAEPALSAALSPATATGTLVPVMATPAAFAAIGAAGAAKAAGAVVGAGAVTGAAYVAYKVATG
ncbi:hypothetical protein GB931_12690 [Modestobacter sp. I12A-02628]|uniref:Uncharacterized protein n=1 Tax=Goekera deserti TaxID=2497753 RepID=A0A7K3W9P8_9ACTN|nr:hypothetical protein [Goekera deserti]MPQ98762.1 hypothetical protein [Goekera deserti]NDI49741.1 hypothetical protein [Goekera deserti]NEL53066.1 hypothetical protein [Goekera deserti]